jgi:hypothetical protein
MRDNNRVQQLQLFTRTELAGMRDRTASRNHSPGREQFRREHERHRAWGLARRHAERLRHARTHPRHPPATSTSGPPSTPAPPPQTAHHLPDTRQRAAAKPNPADTNQTPPATTSTAATSASAAATSASGSGATYAATDPSARRGGAHPARDEQARPRSTSNNTDDTGTSGITDHIPIHPHREDQGGLPHRSRTERTVSPHPRLQENEPTHFPHPRANNLDQGHPPRNSDQSRPFSRANTRFPLQLFGEVPRSHVRARRGIPLAVAVRGERGAGSRTRSATDSERADHRRPQRRHPILPKQHFMRFDAPATATPVSLPPRPSEKRRYKPA